MFEKFVNSIYKPSILFILGVSCFILVTMDVWRSWHTQQNQISWDVANYYSYLPAYFNNNGSFEFNNPIFVNDYLPRLPETNQHIPKTTYGLALMYSPLYALGYKIAINQNDPRDGFSEPFSTTLHWGTIVYALLGLLLLRNFLIHFFSEIVVTLTLAVLMLGTTLFYYSVSNPEAPHSNLFFLMAAFLLTNYHWHRKPTIFRSIIIGLLIGLISLIRPTEIMIALLFIFWPLPDSDSIKNKLKFFLKNYKHIIVMAISGFIVWLPQLLFWKERTGQYFYFSYPGEKFFWTDPQITNVLFSYRKGLFVYTPLIIFAIIGFFFIKDKLKSLRITILIIFVLNLYLISCWWDWFFGGCFGARAFVQHFSYLSIPLASFIAFVFEKWTIQSWNKLVKIATVIIFSLGISLNLMQSYQYANGIIHFNSMTKKTYWLVFGKSKLNDREMGEFWGSLKEPDYEKLKSGVDRDQ